MNARVVIAIALVLLLAAFAAEAGAQLAPGGPLSVRILYDNSGSMYPGYQPPGSPDRRSRAELGARYFHESPAFRQWLGDFVERQTVVDAATVGMWTFTSNDRFTPADIRQVHPVVSVRDFNVSSALVNFPPHTGNTTYLTEGLDAFTRDFTGLVWLITDNIVETDAGQPDEGVKRFFETLNERPEYRSVHLFKYPIEDGGQSAALAVYAILVSAADVPQTTLARYDSRFRALRAAKRPGGADLFPNQEHLKLKNLAIDSIVLRADLQLVLSDKDNGIFKEGQSARLALDGEIRSHLTQHTVTAGRYEISVVGAFAPEPWAQRDLGAQPLAAQVFDTVSSDIREEIPPNGTRDVRAQLRSSQPVSFSPRNPVEWLRLAWKGARVRYTGTVRMSFNDVSVRLERRQIAGIFGIDQVSSIFDFQDVSTLPQVQPSVVPVSFALQTGTKRTAILLALLAVLLAIGTALALIMMRKQAFEITIAGTPPKTIALRRLATHQVTLESKLLGRLSRGLIGYAFNPVVADKTFAVVPSGNGEWDVKFVGGATRRLTIKAEGGGAPKQQVPRPQQQQLPQQPRAAPPGSPRLPAPPPAGPRSAPPPPPRPPRLTR